MFFQVYRILESATLYQSSRRDKARTGTLSKNLDTIKAELLRSHSYDSHLKSVHTVWASHIVSGPLSSGLERSQTRRHRLL